MTHIQKVDLNSKDIKAEQIERLKKIFPEVVADGKINFEQLKATLGEDMEDSKERFGMMWAGKNKCFRIIQDSSTGTLKPSRNESVNFDSTENLFIEGDNLEVLKLLQKSYYEQVKMIYIDPPYNTGKDFVYPDSFGEQVEEYLKITGQIDSDGNRVSTNTDTDGRYHSNWLNMMYPRLFLARNLLADNGIIFISIDDNEIDNLKKLCNEIFGEENFLNQIVLENDSRARPYGSVATTHEYILVYSKSVGILYGELRNQEKQFKFKDKDGGFDLYELRNRNIAFNIKNRPNLYYPFWVNPKKKDENGLYEVSLEKKEGWVEVYPQESQGVKTVWRWGKDKAKTNLNTALFGKEASSTTGFQIVKKYREDTYTLNTVWSDKEIKTDRGTLETKALFDNKKFFDFPKPIALIKRLMSIGADDDSIVMDFFAGSGTTAHAVLEQNKEDGGNRKFICVQLPEPLDEASEAYKAGYKNIADISKERIRRAIKVIEKESKQQKLGSDNKIDLGFRVFKLDRSNFKKWDNQSQELQTSLSEHVDQIKKSANPEDILYEVLIKEGMPLTTKIKKITLDEKEVFSIDNNMLLICLEDKLSKELFKEMKKLNPQIVIVLDSGFKNNDQLKTNAVELMTYVDVDTGRKEYLLRSI